MDNKFSHKSTGFPEYFAMQHSLTVMPENRGK